MSLTIFLKDGVTGHIRRGDILFQIAELKTGIIKQRKFAHAGIAFEESTNHSHASDVQVIHMANVVSVDTWSIWQDQAADACGTVPELDDMARDGIIDAGEEFHHAAPSVFASRNSAQDRHRTCYWMGDPNPNSHPLFPLEPGMYAFSCSTFVYYCYAQVFGELLNIADMPVITDAERTQLQDDLERLYRNRKARSLISGTSFRRLYPSYIMHALATNAYPYSCEDWVKRRSHGYFIPLPIVALPKDRQPI